MWLMCGSFSLAKGTRSQGKSQHRLGVVCSSEASVKADPSSHASSQPEHRQRLGISTTDVPNRKETARIPQDVFLEPATKVLGSPFTFKSLKKPLGENVDALEQSDFMAGMYWLSPMLK